MVAHPCTLVYLGRLEMTNDENNPRMTGQAAVNEAPVDGLDGSGGGLRAADLDAPRDSAENPPEEISLAQYKDLQAKAAKADENWEKYVRSVADLDNYKKRAIRERQDGIRYANESLIEKLLPIVDNFEAALTAANAPQSGNVDSLKMGVNMIHTQLKKFLSEAGIEEIDAAGKPFDPNLHEAVSQEPSTDAPEGQVLRQMRKGYRLRERLVRPAMVVVAKKP
jgi:molecular chaperone GrpE